jgi:hypothetical protein
MLRRLLILAGALLALVGAVGCGGSGHDPVDPEAMLDSAAAHPIRSAEMEIQLLAGVEGVPQLSDPITLRLDGPYVSGGAETIPSFDWRLSASALGFPVGGRLTSTGDNVYLTVYGSRYEVGRSAIATANSRLADAGGLRLRVREWLGPARVVGESNAGGVDCERIAAPLRGDIVRRDLTPLASGLGFEAPAVSGRAVACVGYDDRVLHELELDARLRLSAADSARLGGASAVNLEAQIVSSDVGEPQEIAVPRGPSRPIQSLFLTLGDLVGSI